MKREELEEELGDYEGLDDEHGPLPLSLQIIKDIWDEQADNSDCEPDPDYDLFKHIKKLGLAQEPPVDILVIDCPLCHRPSYYDGGFTDTCSCCGYYNLADHSDEAYTLADYYEELAAAEELP